jgi:MGT family glycosyltransferase
MQTEDRKTFLLATWEGGGSVAPFLTVARKLIARGHRVRFMCDACNGPEAEAVGAEFVAWTRAPSRPDRTPATEVLKDWEYEGPESLIHTILTCWAGPAQAYAEDVAAELRRQPADLVVTSEFLFGVGIGCEALGQPYCVMPVNISMFPVPGVPPVGPVLPPARTPAEQAQYAEIAEQVVGLFDVGLPAVNAARAHFGLAPLDHLVDQSHAALATLLGTARAFDFAPDVLPPKLRYVGPQLDNPHWAAPWVSPFDANDTRPLVLVGFSTTFQNHTAVLQRVMDAAAELPVRLLVTLGGSVAAEALAPPANARLVDSAPHDEVMAQATLVVTHGGHGTVTRTLSHRRPMLVIPHGRDQNDNAVRVTERGAGLALPPSAGVAEIRAALARLLSEPAFRQAATTLGDAVAHEAETSPVAEVLEGLAGLSAATDRCAAA